MKSIFTTTGVESKRTRGWVISCCLAAAGSVLAYVFFLEPPPANREPASNHARVTPAQVYVPQAGNGQAAPTVSGDKLSPGPGRYRDAGARGAVSPDSAAASDGTSASWQAYASVQSRLHDPSFQRTATAQQLLDLPEVQGLSPEQRKQLLDEILGMVQRGELDPKQFLSPPESGAPGNQDGAGATPSAAFDSSVAQQAVSEPDPTPAQLQAVENLKWRLRDPSFSRSLTMQQMQSMPETKDLPSHLRQQLINEVMGMLNRGELDSKQFFGVSGQTDQN